MLFWKDVRNGILLDRPFPFKLHQSYQIIPVAMQTYTAVMQDSRSFGALHWAAAFSLGLKRLVDNKKLSTNILVVE